MPKQKTSKGMVKRFKVTAKGKLKHRSPGASHLLSGKTAKRRRRLRKPKVMTGAMAEKVRGRVAK